jgi:hypothetical protein
VARAAVAVNPPPDITAKAWQIRYFIDNIATIEWIWQIT